MKTRLSCAVAIAALLAAPAYAQQQPPLDPAEPGIPGIPEAILPIDEPVMATQTMDADAFAQLLDEIGIEERERLHAVVARGTTFGDRPFLVVAAPQGFTADEEPDLAFTQLRERFQEGDFRAVQEIELNLARGRYEDAHVLALGGDGYWEGAPLPVYGEIERDTLEQALADLGIEDVRTLEAPVLRARTQDGGTVMMVCGDGDFMQAVEVDVEALAGRVADADLRDVQAMEDVYVMRGTLQDHAILAIVGMPLADVPITGAVD